MSRLKQKFGERSNQSKDSKLEYAWKDIQEAQKTGFDDCKNKILKILKENNKSVSDMIRDKFIVDTNLLIEKIEKL